MALLRNGRHEQRDDFPCDVHAMIHNGIGNPMPYSPVPTTRFTRGPKRNSQKARLVSPKPFGETFLDIGANGTCGINQLSREFPPAYILKQIFAIEPREVVKK